MGALLRRLWTATYSSPQTLKPYSVASSFASLNGPAPSPSTIRLGSSSASVAAASTAETIASTSSSSPLGAPSAAISSACRARALDWCAGRIRVRPAVPAGAAEVGIVNFKFTPATVTIKVGGTIDWTNHDDIGHTVTFAGQGINSKVLQRNDRFSHTFDTPGTYTYICSIHPFMHGTVVVTG